MKPMEGIRIIEASMFAFVPGAAGVLAHWGADVIEDRVAEHARPDASWWMETLKAEIRVDASATSGGSGRSFWI